MRGALWVLRVASYPRSIAPCFAPEALAGRLRSASRSRRSTQVVTGSRSSLAWARRRTRRSTGSRHVTVSRGVRPVGGLPAPALLPPLANGVILLRGLRFDHALLYAELQPHVFQREVKRVLDHLLAGFSLGVERGHWPEDKLFEDQPIHVLAKFLEGLPIELRLLLSQSRKPDLNARIRV